MPLHVTGGKKAPMTNAERQAKWREKRKMQPNSCISISINVPVRLRPYLTLLQSAAEILPTLELVTVRDPATGRMLSLESLAAQAARLP